MAEKIRGAVCGSPAVHRGESIPVTLSLGVGQLRQDEEPQSLLSRIDLALYAAKEKGKNRSETAA
jgi:PleD family two-component response regulator